jgi:hypothetical protein
MVTDEQCESAMRYLASTDETSAILKGNVARAEYSAKMARSKVYLTSEGSVEARKATAETSAEVLKAEDELANAIVEHEKVKAKRATRELLVEVWRSVFSARKQGMNI